MTHTGQHTKQDPLVVKIVQKQDECSAGALIKTSLKWIVSNTATENGEFFKKQSEGKNHQVKLFSHFFPQRCIHHMY